MALSLLRLLVLATTVVAHGYVSSPPARQAGPATDAACGKLVADVIRADNTSHVEGLPEEAAQAGSGYHADACNLWLCKGLQYADNAANVQRWAAGATVEMRVLLTIPHDGTANVSIVDLARNEVVGDMLLVWDAHYANEAEFHAGTLPRNNTAFNVTLPDVSERCGTAGACVRTFWICVVGWTCR
jgi:hypothetical protein